MLLLKLLNIYFSLKEFIDRKLFHYKTIVYIYFSIQSLFFYSFFL